MVVMMPRTTTRINTVATKPGIKPGFPSLSLSSASELALTSASELANSSASELAGFSVVLPIGSVVLVDDVSTVVEKKCGCEIARIVN